MPKIFRQRHGYDLLPHLPELFYTINDQPASPARYHYHECLSWLFAENFCRQIGDWCVRHKLDLTGHMLAEDTLACQISVCGDSMRAYEYMQAPGLDLLTEHWRIYNTAKQVSSVARQFGRARRLTETYGCTGWDFSFEGHKALGDWQTALGINFRFPEASLKMRVFSRTHRKMTWHIFDGAGTPSSCFWPVWSAKPVKNVPSHFPPASGNLKMGEPSVPGSRRRYGAV